MSQDRTLDEIQYLIFGDTMISIAQITHIRPGKPHAEDEGDYVVNLSGTRRVMLNDEDGKKLWAFLSARALDIKDLAVG